MTSSYSGDSLRGKPAQFIPKSRTLDTVNSLLGRSFSLGDLSHSPQTTKKVEKMVKEVKKKGINELPPRDKKIAAIMIAKHEEENIRKEQRYWAHIQWETQRKSSVSRRELEERERHRAILQGQRMLETHVRKRRGKMLSEDLNTAEMEKQSKGKVGKLESQQKNISQIKSQKSKQQKKTDAPETRNSSEEESDSEERRKTFEKNLNRAQENVEQLHEKRNQEIKSRAQREEQQIQRARQAAELREKERAETT
ncbi:unnamed protein product [Ranitomeya imitator]|uniref:Uncharacterized protein n=1 Tax=Ranitomeya imitator TaxID=111125 RepID=A0ABN9MP12_9NEOB|nr:unnamed protein product [Ranitomeya imitator]